MITNDEFKKLEKLIGSAIDTKVPKVVQAEVRKETKKLETKIQGIVHEEVKKESGMLELKLKSIVDDATEHLVTKADLKYLPTKDEFYEKMDELAGMMKKILEAQDLITQRNTEQDDQLENLDKRVKKTERVLNIS